MSNGDRRGIVDMTFDAFALGPSIQPESVQAAFLDDCDVERSSEDTLQEWVVSSRVDKSGVGDDDQTLIDLVDCA